MVVVNRCVQDGSVRGQGDPRAAPGGVGNESACANPHLGLKTAFPCTEASVRVRTGSGPHEDGEGMPETNGDPRKGQQKGLTDKIRDTLGGQ
jgi:hypothetical protein